LRVSPSRKAAFQILQKVEQAELSPGDQLHSEVVGGLSPADRHLATELVYGVLRSRLLLDHLLSSLCRTSLAKFDLPVLQALRLGLYQLLFLSRIPARAAVHESVEIVKWQKVSSAAALVNAVLRKASPDILAQTLNQLPEETAEGMSLRFSHPLWLVKKWCRKFGMEKTREVLELNNRTPHTFFRINSPDLSEKEMIGLLRREGIQAGPTPWPGPVFAVEQGDLSATSLFKCGVIAIQDAGSQLIPMLLSPQPGEQILDLCSAPGGKASELAALCAGEARVVAMDFDGGRLQTARRLHQRHWKSLHLLVADGMVDLPFSITFDKILVDVPCSGSGTLQRNPDIRWKLKEGKLAEFQSRQLALLRNASRWLKRGGKVVYSTCSLEAEENEQVISRFLTEQTDFEKTLPENPRLQSLFDADKNFRIFPSEINGDGFFAVLLERK
jgi:16S rRNA (cytosine967-C5)-methyltransferase